MALRYIDSLGDHYTAAQATAKWTTTSAVVRDTGLHGYGMRGSLLKGMLFGSTTIIMEAYINRTSFGGADLFQVGDTGANIAAQPIAQIECSYKSDGSIQVSRSGSNPGADLIAVTAPDLVREHVWYHVAWKVLLHPTAGTVDVRLNGATILSLTGISTTSGLGAAYWSGAIGSFSLGDNGASCIFDDLVVMDDVDDGLNDLRLPGGGGFDKFIGPVEIAVKRPSGAGLVAEWAPSTGANYQNVDDLESDDDATYNEADAASVGDSDLFAMENLLPTEDVVAAQSLVLARKTEEGVAAVGVLVHDGGVTTVGPAVQQPSTYAYVIRAEPARPGGALWTAAAWDAIQYGYRRLG